MAFRLQAPAAACRQRSSSPESLNVAADWTRMRTPSPERSADWTRMRTPSPERSYVHGYPLLAPQILLAPVFVPCVYMPEPLMTQQPPPVYTYDVEIHESETDTTKSDVLDTLPKDFIHSNLKKVTVDDTFSEADTTDVGSEDSSLGSEHSSIEEMDLDLPDLPEGVPSIGSLNHPHSCSQPCKYIKKVRGCKDGLNCTHCHLCTWQSRRHGKSKKNKCIPEVGELTL